MSYNVKITTILNPLDWLAPHSCRGCGRTGDVLCDCCKKNITMNIFSFCPNLGAEKIKGFPKIYALGKREGVLALLIHDFKYNSTRAIGTKLAELMSIRLPDLPKNSIIVPLPTATHHIRERGFDHTYFIARRIAKLKHIKTKRIFIRTANTVQVGADRSTRLAQAEHAFEINPKIKLKKDATYILFDDVWTTGASMKSALKKLRAAGALKIIIALLATSSLD